MKKLIFVMALLLMSGCVAKENKPDVKEIKIYDFEDFLPDENGEENPEPIIITDEKEISVLVELGGIKSDYKDWKKDNYEGINSYWVDFGNGMIVGMYDDIDYCMFCEYVGEPYGGPYYKTPKGFREKIIEIMEE